MCGEFGRQDGHARTSGCKQAVDWKLAGARADLAAARPIEAPRDSALAAAVARQMSELERQREIAE